MDSETVCKMEPRIFQVLSEKARRRISHFRMTPGKNEKAPDMPEPSATELNAFLVERVLNRRERGLQLGAEALHDGDDGNGNTRRDQAVLNGRRTGLILHETRNEGLHLSAP